MISLIWAQTPSGVIGLDNKLPWSIKTELNHFRKYTNNKAVLMGSKTFSSIGRVLPNRINYVLTRNPKKFSAFSNYTNFKPIVTCDALIEQYRHTTQELCVIGGLEVYRLLIDVADQLIVSIIKKEYKGDVIIDFVNYNNFVLKKIEIFDEFEIRTYERK